jgi:hypothetical protein
MTKIEYRVVVLKPSDGNFGGWRVAYTALADEKVLGTDANAYLEFLGEAGWELVSSQTLVAPVAGMGMSPPGLALTFKRL